jgi:hypothetical protein
MALVAVRTVAVIEHMLLDLLSDAEERKDRARGAEAAAVEVLAQTIRENDPASSRHQAGLRDDIKKDGRSIAVTEFTSSILAHLLSTNRSRHRPLKSNRYLRSFVEALLACYPGTLRQRLM